MGRRTDDGRVLAYYEGNLYGAENLPDLAGQSKSPSRTWEEQVRMAWFRLRDRAPTVAFLHCPEGDLIEVAEGNEATGWPTVATDPVTLAAWLEGTDIEQPTPDGGIPPVDGLDNP